MSSTPIEVAFSHQVKVPNSDRMLSTVTAVGHAALSIVDSAKESEESACSGRMPVELSTAELKSAINHITHVQL